MNNMFSVITSVVALFSAIYLSLVFVTNLVNAIVSNKKEDLTADAIWMSASIALFYLASHYPF
jgi:hypothetical protein